MYSSAKTPCPICGRTSSGCKTDGDLLYCRIGTKTSPFQKHPQLKTGDVVGEWACVKINPTAECVTFKPHKERTAVKYRSWKYFAPNGRSYQHNRTDYNVGPKDVTWSKGTKVDTLLPLWYESLPDSGETVYVVEGETCAEALRALGLWVTSVPNGSGSWKGGMPDMPKLQDNSLVLCPDRDRPGVELMQRLGDAFPGSSWLWVEGTNADAWDDPSDGYDVADWVVDGANRERIELAIRRDAPQLPVAPWYERIGDYKTEKGGYSRLKLLDLSKVLSSMLHGALRWNDLKQAIEIDGAPMSEIDAKLSYGSFQAAHIDVSKDVAQDALLLSARERPYHPIRDYLESCNDPLDDATWQNIAGELLGSHAVEFDNSALRKWLVFCVARIYEPGCPCGFVHILAGDQHLHKTRFYNTLASEAWFYEGFIKTNKDADDITGLHMRWICEWGELDGGIKNRDSAGLKNFITRKTDLVREAYGKGHKERPRSFVLCGTTNKKDGFFSDETGNRRFVIFNVEERINSEKIEDLRDRIWASAKREYFKGTQWFLDEAETQINNDRNRGLYAEDPWLEKISSHLVYRSTEYVISSDLLTHVLEVPIERQTQRELVRINRILTACGYYKSRKKLNGSFKHIWRRCGTDE